MKKFIKIVIYVLVFYIIYFLQISFFEEFTIAGIKPNMFIIAIIIIGLYSKPEKSFIIGVLCGLLIDLFDSKVIGLTAIGLGMLGYIISSAGKMFSIESKLSLIIFIFAGTLGYEILINLIKIIILQENINIQKIMLVNFIEGIYNIILTIIFYPLCKKVLKIGSEDVQENRIDSYLKRMR